MEWVCYQSSQHGRKPTSASKRFIKWADSLYALKLVTSSVADNAKFQYDQMKEVITNKDKFLAFNFRTQHVNEFLGYYVGNNPEYKALWEVCKLIFVLNKNVSDVNMQEDFVDCTKIYLRCSEEKWQ